MNVLVLLALPELDVPKLLVALQEESRHAGPLIAMAQQQGAIVAAHCAAGYFLADAGVLDRKRATISWWLKADVLRRFPKVRWDASQLLVRQGRIYTCGGGFSGLELAKALICDLGYAKEERIVRKLLVLPPSRRLQTPYEFPLEEVAKPAHTFSDELYALTTQNLQALSVSFLAQRLRLSPRTLSRRFSEEMRTSPRRWIQERRLEAARNLLEVSNLSISEICYRVGYQDVPSFGRLFAKTTRLTPGEYRRQSR